MFCILSMKFDVVERDREYSLRLSNPYYGTVEAETAADVFVNGASNLLGSPEFVDPEKIKSMMQALERKRTLLDLLGRVIDGAGVQVVIGEEQVSPGLADCSLVASTYGTGDRIMGTLGVVGPKRMEYARAIVYVFI